MQGPAPDRSLLLMPSAIGRGGRYMYVSIFEGRCNSDVELCGLYQKAVSLEWPHFSYRSAATLLSCYYTYEVFLVRYLSLTLSAVSGAIVTGPGRVGA